MPEDSITPSRHRPVDGIAEDPGDDPEDVDRAVDPARRGDREERSITSIQQPGACLVVVRNDEDGGQRVRLTAVLPEDFRSQRPLQGGEAELVLAVNPEQELHEMIAQRADAVVEDEVGHEDGG